MEVKFQFALGSKVILSGIDGASNRYGKVVGNYIDRDEKKWTNVQYADHSGRVTIDYFREEDLSAAA